MASRQEEKERRRQERVEREAAEARSASRRKRLQLVGGGVLAAAAIAAVLVAVAVGFGGSDEGEPRQAAPNEAAAAALPEQEIADLQDAAEAAGCTLDNPDFQGQSHADREFTPADYETNPPTSGDHNPTWYEDGIYEPGSTPRLGELVHTLEHGRIDVQYRPNTPTSVTDQLEAFVAENDGYHMVMFENTTDMPFEVAATAWTHSLTCEEMKPEVFDALRTFRDEYLDKGPEQVP